MRDVKGGALTPWGFALTAAIISVFFASPVCARGVALIQQSNGTVRTYSNVAIDVTGQTLVLRSADRQGVLTIAMGACSFTSKIERCLPYAMTLTQQARSQRIALSHGSVFLNLLNAPHRLPRSSEELAPHTALVLVKTAHGTYITAKGTLDQVQR